MARAILAFFCALAALLPAGCALAPEQREVIVSAQKLSELIGRRMSVDKKVLEVFRLRTGKPEVVLDPQAQRLRVELDVSLGHPFSARPLDGRAAISGGLAFDAATRTVLLTEPKVEKLDFEAVPAALREPVSRLGTALSKELLASYPLVTLQPGQLSALGREYRVVGFDIAPEGLKIMLTARP
jgi:hypothetical protein